MSRHLHIETYGAHDATPEASTKHLVLIHGWGMHSAVWQPVIKKLAKHYCLHLVDLPGMGKSDPIDTPKLNAIAERLLADLPTEANICGWSLGGLVAMRMALMRPDRVQRLILVGSTPCFVNKGGKAAWKEGIDAEVFRDFALQVSVDYQTTMLKFLTLQCMGSKDTRSIVKQLRESFAERPTPTVMTLQNALRVLLENDLRPEIPMLKQPTLLIHGDRDSLAPVQAANWMSQHLPEAHLRVISGASHAPFLSHTEQFIDTLLGFLENNTA